MVSYTHTHTTFTAVVIGFAEPSYMVTEPTSGVTTVRVCVELVTGRLGRQVRIIPEFEDLTATGIHRVIQIILNLVEVYCMYIIREVCDHQSIIKYRLYTEMEVYMWFAAPRYISHV